MDNYFVISKGTEYLRIPASRLVYISAAGNYSEIVMQDGRRRIVTYQLGQLVDMINDQLGEAGEQFVRIGRSLIINQEFLHWIDITKQELVLSDCHGCYYELKASREVLVSYKAYLEAFNEK